MADNVKNYVYSSSPHKKAPHTTKWIMLNVCIALLPATIMGIVYFGLNAFLLVIISLAAAVISEFVFYLIAGKKINEIAKDFDYSSCVTGLLIALTLGVNYPLYAPIFGSAFAVVVVKLLFGGTGKNFANPAIVGRIFIFISFQSVVGKWLAPSISSVTGGTLSTGATTLVDILENGSLPSLSVWDLLLGTGLSGCIGETCKIALLVGAVYLAALQIIDIKLPLIGIAVSGLFAVALKGFDFSYFLPSILTGGLVLGMFFMATDYATTPNTKLGNYIYFVALGLLCAGLRQATKMEAVSFAILLMNLVVPLIDKFILNRPFGFVKVKKAKAIPNVKEKENK